MQITQFARFAQNHAVRVSEIVRKDFSHQTLADSTSTSIALIATTRGRLATRLRLADHRRMYHIPAFPSAAPRFGVWFIMVIAIAGYPDARLAQDRALTPDSSIAIPPLQFDGSGALVIRASSTSSQHDFDYLVGTWKLRNRKLTSRLTHSTEWVSFESHVEMHQILNGLGNIDKYTDQASAKPY
jgi:hypothetical protein